MFDKLKQKIKILRTKTANPIVSLNDADKVYLACVRRDDELFSYVLALVCERQENTRMFNLYPQTEVLTFNTRTGADAFYGTVQQLSRVQRTGSLSALFDMHLQQIKDFNDKAR